MKSPNYMLELKFDREMTKHGPGYFLGGAGIASHGDTLADLMENARIFTEDEDGGEGPEIALNEMDEGTIAYYETRFAAEMLEQDDRERQAAAPVFEASADANDCDCSMGEDGATPTMCYACIGKLNAAAKPLRDRAAKIPDEVVRCALVLDAYLPKSIGPEICVTIELATSIILLRAALEKAGLRPSAETEYLKLMEANHARMLAEYDASPVKDSVQCALINAQADDIADLKQKLGLK